MAELQVAVRHLFARHGHVVGAPCAVEQQRVDAVLRHTAAHNERMQLRSPFCQCLMRCGVEGGDAPQAPLKGGEHSEHDEREEAGVTEEFLHAFLLELEIDEC